MMLDLSGSTLQKRSSRYPENDSGSQYVEESVTLDNHALRDNNISYNPASSKAATWALASALAVGGSLSASAGVGLTTSTWDTRLPSHCIRYARDQYHNDISDHIENAGQFSDAIVSELGRLRDGWSGSDSVAPSEAVRADVTEFLSSLALTENNLPEVEVDDDGSVTFIWLLSDQDMLTFDFVGNGKTSCAYTNKDVSRSAFVSIDSSNDIALAAFLSSIDLKELDLIAA